MKVIRESSAKTATIRTDRGTWNPDVKLLSCEKDVLKEEGQY